MGSPHPPVCLEESKLDKVDCHEPPFSFLFLVLLKNPKK